eukprot:189955_1
MCDRVLAECGKECEYFRNFYDDNFIERSSIGYYQYLHSSLYHANASNCNDSDTDSDKPLLPKISTGNKEEEEFEEDEHNIYQHPFRPSQSYLNRLMPKEEKGKGKARGRIKERSKVRSNHKTRTKLTTLMSGSRTKGSVSGKNSTIPQSLNDLISDNFMLLPSQYIAKYDNFYSMTDMMQNKLKLLGNYECIQNERQRFLRCSFTAKDKINSYLSRCSGNIQYSWKWNDVLSCVSTSKKSKYEHGWNSSWVLPLLQMTVKNEDTQLDVLRIVNKLLLSCDLYCLYYESRDIIATLKQWLFDLLSRDDSLLFTLLNFVIHTGCISTMFDVFDSLLKRDVSLHVNIDQIWNKIESEIHYWYSFGCPLIPHKTMASFMHERRIEHQALYLHSVDALRNITYSNMTTDGAYLYIYHRKFGLFKIGTGYGDTIQGKIYGLNESFTSQILKMIAPPGLSGNNHGLGNAQITSYDKYGQRYYGGNNTANPSKDIMVTSLIFCNKELFFRSREMLNHLMIRVHKDTLAPLNIVDIAQDNPTVWVADIDRITSFDSEYLLALHSPVICKHKLATRQGICSYSITGKRSVPQRWTQIIVSSDANAKYYICAACSNRCYRESGGESAGYKKTVLSATLPRLSATANGAMFCDCGSDRIPAPTNKEKYTCVCVNKEYLNQLELHLDERLKEPRIESEKWRDDLATNSKVDTLDSVHKWYTSTIIDVDQTSDRIRINYDGWSSRYDEWLGRYDPRIQPHKTRAVGGRESGGIIGSIDQKGAPRQINQLSPVKTEFKVFILDQNKLNVVGHVQCAPIGNQYKNQLPSSYDFYSTGNNIIFQWLSNNQCGVKIHLAVYSIPNINKYLYQNTTESILIQPNVYHVPYQPIIHRHNPLLPVTKAFGLTLMDVMSGGVCYDATNHCLWCYDPTFMILDQIQCLPKPVRPLDDILESNLESLPPSPAPPASPTPQEHEQKETQNDESSIPPSSCESIPLHAAITAIVEQLSRLIEYETDHAYLIEINHAAKQELEKKVSSEPTEQQNTYKRKRKYKQKLGGSGSASGSLSPANEANKSFSQTQESYNLGSGMDALLKYVKRLQCLSKNDLMDSLHAAQKLILFAHQQIVQSLATADHFMENMIKLRLYAFKIFIKLTKVVPLYENAEWALPLNEILDMIAYIATKEHVIAQTLSDKPKISKLLLETQTVCLNAVIHGMRFFVDCVDDTYDTWHFLSVMVASNHQLRWEVVKALTMILPNQQIFDKLSDSVFHKDVLLFLIKESFNTADTFIRNVLSGTSNDKEYSHALTSNTHLQILCVFHHKVLWKTFQCTDTDDDYVQTFIEYIEYIFMETKGLLNTIQSLMQNKKFSLSKLQQLTKTLSESPIQLLIPSIISFLSSPNMMRITWRIFNGGSPEDKEWRTCSIHLNDLVLILDQFIAFCGIDTCNLSLISNHAKNRSNSYPPMVLNSEHPWKCMQNKWYVIQDANLSSLYLTFHPNSSTPNTDGELKIGLQQHHVASIPRTALDIHLRGLFGAWPILPIEIPTDRLYLRWQKTETPSFKPYVDLLHDYFNKEITNHASMWGFRMESYGLVRSSRTIYKQSDPTIFKFGFKPNRLPFLVDIQTEVISLSKSLGFNYMLTPHAHPRGYRRNKAIPTQLFSSTIFAAGWDGKTLRITEKVQVPRTQTDSDKDTNGDEDKEKEEVKETEDTVKIYDVDYDDPSKTVAQGLYRDPNTSPSNARALSLWSSVSQNLMIPKSLEKIITELRLPVLSALIRHLPLEQQSLFVEQNTDTSDEGMEIIKQVFMIGNNILRWVLDNLMSEKKAFEKIETVYTLAVREKDLQKRVTEITDEKLRLVKEMEEEQPEKDEEEKEQTHEQKQDMDEKEETKEDNTKEENPQQTKLNNEMVQILEEMENVEADLMSEIETICKTMQSFCHKYFTVYCEGNGVRLGFSRSSLDVNEISQHLNGWITKCLESLLDHKPDLDVCLNHFNRAFKNRIQIVLQLKWNTNLTLKHLQQFLCNDYYFCYSDNPVLEIHMMMTQRQKGTKHRVEAIQHLLQLMECAEQCNATYPLALAVHVPPAPLKRWCYTNGLEGLPIEDIKDLKLIFAKWLSKMLSIGNDLHRFTTQKVNKQQSHRQKFIKWRSPKKSNKAKDKKEEKKDPEPEAKPEVQKKKVIPKSPRLSNQQLVSMSTEHFLDIFQIVLSSISCAQFNKNDMNLLFETKAMQTLFDWESKMCRCEYPYPTPLLHKSDFMWNEILKVLHSCSEGVFQWIESDAMHEKDDKQKQIALDLSSNILSQILNRLHTELHFICSINEDSLNEEMAAVEELNKRKMKPSEVKQWTYKRILTSHQCMLKYFQLLHRLSTFKTAYHPLTAPDNTIYYSYLTLLFGILCNHQCLQHDHHRIYSLCIQKLCDLLPTLDLDSFNQIIHESKDNVLLSFDDDQSFVTFILKSIGSYLYFDKPALDQMSLTRTLSILSESDKVSGYSDANRHGTYSLILKIPSEINTNSFIKYLVPKYLNDEFQSMINSLTNVPTVAKKKPKNASPDKSQSDVAILQSFVDEEPDSNYDNNDDDDDYNEDDEDYDENEEEEDDDDEEEEEEEDAHDDYDEEHE